MTKKCYCRGVCSCGNECMAGGVCKCQDDCKCKKECHDPSLGDVCEKCVISHKVETTSATTETGKAPQTTEPAPKK